jgi:hypothetical protein
MSGWSSEKSFAVAERLQALKIPFVFVTGYGSSGAPPAFGNAEAAETLSTDVLERAAALRCKTT